MLTWVIPYIEAIAAAAAAAVAAAAATAAAAAAAEAAGEKLQEPQQQRQQRWRFSSLTTASLTWMPNSLAAAVGFDSFDANDKTNHYHIKHHRKPEAAIDYPYLPPTYFCRQNCEKQSPETKLNSFA